MRRSSHRLVAIAAVAAVGLVAVPSGSIAAGATFPGANGPLVFSGVDQVSHTTQLYRVTADGTGLTLLTEVIGQQWNECPSVSADGATIFFDSLVNPGNGLIYRMQADGSGRQLSDQQQNVRAHYCPSVGPGGAQVVAVQYARGHVGAIVRMNLDGTGRQILARAGRNQMLFDPLYAPNGRQIILNRVTFSGDNISRSQLIISRGRGKKPIDVTPPRSAGLFSNPSWAPNGASLLATQGDNTIVRMNATGGNVQVVTTVPGVLLENPVFSPDGSKIAYLQCEPLETAQCGDPAGAGEGSLYVMNADGSNPEAIVTQDSTGIQPANKVDWSVASR
jgi:Tol biopolymer transport system component